MHLRASDDGVAFRTAGRGRECSAFEAPRGTRAWLQRYGVSYERPYDKVLLRSADPGAIGFPALLLICWRRQSSPALT